MICADERQYLPPGGQRWTTSAERAAEGCHIEIEELEPDLYGLTAHPKADIGQTALLVRTTGGNLLWDVPGYLDEDAVAAVGDLGGVAAIMASHPHMYGAQLEWARAFGAPVWISEKDRGWVRREGPELRTWSESFEVLPGIHASQPGGHFPGSAVALWTAGAEGRGVLLSGDTIAAVPAEGWVTLPAVLPEQDPALRCGRWPGRRRGDRAVLRPALRQLPRSGAASTPTPRSGGRPSATSAG